jgi:aminopeptidase C
VFDFEYRDENNDYHIDRELTPQMFYDKYIGVDLDEYVSIINAPTKDKPYNKSYTVEMLGNVVGGKEVKYSECRHGNIQKTNDCSAWNRANLFGLAAMLGNHLHETAVLWQQISTT